MLNYLKKKWCHFLLGVSTNQDQQKVDRSSGPNVQQMKIIFKRSVDTIQQCIDLIAICTFCKALCEYRSRNIPPYNNVQQLILHMKYYFQNLCSQLGTGQILVVFDFLAPVKL